LPPRAGQPIHSNAAAEKQSMSESDSMWSQKGATMSDNPLPPEGGPIEPVLGEKLLKK